LSGFPLSHPPIENSKTNARDSALRALPYVNFQSSSFSVFQWVSRRKTISPLLQLYHYLKKIGDGGEGKTLKRVW